MCHLKVGQRSRSCWIDGLFLDSLLVVIGDTGQIPSSRGLKPSFSVVTRNIVFTSPKLYLLSFIGWCTKMGAHSTWAIYMYCGINCHGSLCLQSRVINHDKSLVLFQVYHVHFGDSFCFHFSVITRVMQQPISLLITKWPVDRDRMCYCI